jgi:hypothetical protein
MRGMIYSSQSECLGTYALKVKVCGHMLPSVCPACLHRCGGKLNIIIVLPQMFHLHIMVKFLGPNSTLRVWRVLQSFK